MKEPTLVVLAAGMGSRYGGLKQIDPVDDERHTLLDFSVYDAIRAGFKKVVFIIKHAIEEDFVRMVGSRMEPFISVEYVFQELDEMPEGYAVPEGREKPFGTGHALLCCKDVIQGPFMVINADDYYGPKAFRMLYNFLTSHEDGETYSYSMIGYYIENTITENGSVSRGICQVDDENYLTDITERTRIEKKENGAAFTLDNGKTWENIPDHTLISMNCWGFTPGIMRELEQRFPIFLDTEVKSNPLKAEFFLPSVVDALLKEGKASVKVLESEEKWYGVTYQEDKRTVMEAIQAKKADGLYPQELWK